jgi:typhoid toxin secretion A
MSIEELKRKLIAEVIDREGGYSNRSEDRGGPTNWGITIAVARENGYTGDMRALPRSTAAAIYAGVYWHSLKLDEVAELSTDLALVLFDFGVNSGPGRAAEYLQRQLNVLNNRGQLYPDIAVDRAFGNESMKALKGFVAARGQGGLEVLAHAVNAERIVFCRGLAERSEDQETFTYGWFKRVVELLSNVLRQQPVPSEWLNEVAALPQGGVL